MTNSKNNKSGSRRDEKVNVRTRVKISFGKAQRHAGMNVPRSTAPKTGLETEAGGRRPDAARPRISAIHDTALSKAQESLGSIKGHSGVDLTEKVRELIGLARAAQITPRSRR